MNVLTMNGLKMDIKKIETQWDGKFDDIIPVLRQRRFFDPEYHASRSKRKVIPGYEYKWRLPIRYYFDEYINATLKVTIMKAIAHWEKETCIRFVHDVAPEGDYLKFRSPGGVGCASFVGKIGGQQNIFLDTGCEFVAIVAHEIGHSIGFFHEQSRPNRNDYLLINMSTIDILAASNFHIDEGIDYGSPYDHGSIMHYGPNAFLQKGLVGPVIRTTDPLMQTTIGSGYELSFYDARSANRYYCSDNCSDAPKLDCQNMGYLDPNNCSICKCPNILSGRLCDEVEPSKGDCPDNVGDVILTPSSPTLIINSYNYPNNYSLSSRCNWRVKAVNPNNTSSNPKLIFQFYQTTIFDIVISNISGACRHFLEVKYGVDVAATGPRFCGNTSYPNIIISHTDTLLLGFRSFSQHTNHTSYGFKAIITYCESCTPNATRNISSKFDPDDFTVTYTWAYTESPYLTLTGNPDEARSTTNVSDGKPACPTKNKNNFTTPVPTIRQPCSKWTDWSLCTEPCGGCGKQVSLRVCLPFIDKSEWVKTRNCKPEPCFVNKNYICHVPKYYPTYDCLCQRTKPCCYGYSPQNDTCQQIEVINPEDIGKKILDISRVPTRSRISKVRAENVVENDESLQVGTRSSKNETIFDFILNHVDFAGRIFIN
ncbi:unnamed protein product [Gordionus sp. m RMFG-2023]